MRSGGFAVWCLIAALLPGFGSSARGQELARGQATGGGAKIEGEPPETEVIRAGAKILAEEPLCVLAPRALDHSWGEHMFVEAKDRAAIEPFIQAGLLQFVDKPAGQPDNPERLWYDVTPYGQQWSAPSCLVNRYAYPVHFGWGFRIGTPEIGKTYPLMILTRGECETSASVMFEYRMKLEPWFVPGRFETNFGTNGGMHYFDAAQNVGRAQVRYTSGDGKHWTEEPISYGHGGYVICEKLK
ncbi:hypothetical protein ACCC88_03600 [Sphingomonas sp. Sphisp140]